MYKCKECGIEKELSEFYSHPLTKDGISHRCKVCIKQGRKTNNELKMSRIRDRDRYYNNTKRREYIFRSSKERRIRKGYQNIHCKADREIEKYGRPNYCAVCGGGIDGINILRIIFHHPDYMKPFEGVFCCDICHSKIHLGKIECKDKIINIKI